MKTHLAACLALAIIMVGGCAFVDGVNTWHVHGRLIDNDDKPVAGARVVAAVGLDYDPPPGVWENDFATTDGTGAFDAPARKSWGGMYPIFMIPSTHTAKELEQIVVYIGLNGRWQKHVRPLAKEQQTKVADNDRWIELGDVPFDLQGPSVTINPAAGG